MNKVFFKNKLINSKVYSFTLVELMVVLAILAIIAGIVIFVVKPGDLLDQ